MSLTVESSNYKMLLPVNMKYTYRQSLYSDLTKEKRGLSRYKNCSRRKVDINYGTKRRYELRKKVIKVLSRRLHCGIVVRWSSNGTCTHLKGLSLYTLTWNQKVTFVINLTFSLLN